MMTQIEFITSTRVAGLSDETLYDFILNRIMDNRIVVLEKELNAQQQMELIARGLEKVINDNAIGINFKPFYVTTHVSGLLRPKEQEVQFNLITPGSSTIYETEEGTYEVVSHEGETVSAVF